MQADTYQIHLEHFEGPFDLLLFFIERDELDIYDIPIAKITHDFLSYLHSMERLQIEMASEFILVASKLMKIKAAMLLPRPKLDESGEAIDPRTELVDRLLEYQRFKAAREEIERLETDALTRIKRGFIEADNRIISESTTTPGDELVGVTLYKLFKVFEAVTLRMDATAEKPKHVVQPYPYSVEQVRDEILAIVQKTARPDFLSIVKRKPERIYVIFCFLTILELAAKQSIKLVIGEGYNNFWIEKKRGVG